jgi:hypothetical protein
VLAALTRLLTGLLTWFLLAAALLLLTGLLPAATLLLARTRIALLLLVRLLLVGVVVHCSLLARRPLAVNAGSIGKLHGEMPLAPAEWNIASMPPGVIQSRT